MTTLEDRIARLEARVERQAAIIEQQQRTIAELEGEPPSGGATPSRQSSARARSGQPGH